MSNLERLRVAWIKAPCAQRSNGQPFITRQIRKKKIVESTEDESYHSGSAIGSIVGVEVRCCLGIRGLLRRCVASQNRRNLLDIP